MPIKITLIAQILTNANRLYTFFIIRPMEISDISYNIGMKQVIRVNAKHGQYDWSHSAVL